MSSRYIIMGVLILVLLGSLAFADGQKGADDKGSEKGLGVDAKINESKNQKSVDETVTGAEKSGENEKGQETGKGQGVQVEQETKNKGENKTIQIQEKERLKTMNVSELKLMMQERKQEMNKTLQNLDKTQQKIYQNQNVVRLTVHTLLAMNLTGGIGRNVSQIAREFNNSVQSTIKLEEKIQTRNSLMRFFFGGDENAADEMEQELNRTRERIQTLKQLFEECDCDEEIKAMMQEQIQEMEQEQTRLQNLAQSEKKAKGLLGWLWK